METPADGRRPRSRKPLGVTPVGVRLAPSPHVPLAQQVELLTLNQRVRGSSPRRRTRRVEEIGRPRRPHEPERAGSNPAPAPVPVAQQEERRPDTAEAAGSIPAPDTEPSTNARSAGLSTRIVRVQVPSALLDPSSPNRQGSALLMRIGVSSSLTEGAMPRSAQRERAPSHGGGRRFDTVIGHCGRSSMAERQVVALETPVQLRSITPSERADAGESGPAVTRLHTCSGGSSPPARTMPA